MKKVLSGLIAAAALVACTFGATAQRSIHNPMTQAVLQVYEEELRENPSDYNVLLSRADEYYRHAEYLRALADVDAALGYIPAEDKPDLLRARMLRAGINNSLSRHADAMADLEAAAVLEPNSFNIILQKANTEFALGRYADAKTDYQRIVRLNPRSAEPYLGLAAVAVKENNIGIATEMLDRAVNTDPNSAEIYIRRAEVKKMMGDHNGAVDDLVLAMSIDANNSRALAALVDYAETNYPAAMTGLSSAVTAAPRNGMFRYLRARIAQGHYHYLAALDDYQYIVNNNLDNYHGINASIAECQYALGRYDDALASIDYALGQANDNALYFTLRSRILRALGRYDEAVRASALAMVINREDGDVLAEMALARAATGEYDQASSLLGEAMMVNAENPRYPILRGWVAQNNLNNASGARQFYTTAADIDAFDLDNVNSLKGFALIALDRPDEARRWIENILTTVTDHDGLVNYYATCIFAQLGDNERAMQCAARSLDLGYADYHNWTEQSEANLNVGPLRDDLRFLNLLSRHNAIFGRQ